MIMSHIVTISEEDNFKSFDILEMIGFCKERYNFNEDWDWYSNAGEIVFRFKNEGDAVEFKLRYL